MSSSLNKVSLIGHVGNAPEIRQMQNGIKIASFSMATGESWKDKASGEWKTKTEWHKIVCMNERLSEVIEKYVTKGSKLYISGQLQTRKWTDKQGKDVYTTEVILSAFKGEIILLDKKEAQSNNDADGSPSSVDSKSYELNDEVPF